jgi:hypothetical protein
MVTSYKENLKEWLELADDIRNKRGDAIDCGNKCPSLFEAYNRGYISCHLHLSIQERITGRRKEYCANLNVLNPCLDRGFTCGTDIAYDTPSDYFPDSLITRQEGSDKRKADNWNNHTVFIYAGEVSKERQFVDIFPTPSIGSPCQSVIRLQSLDDCDMFRGYVPKVSLRFLNEFLFGSSLIDSRADNRELYGPSLFKTKCSALVMESELVDEVVKGTPQIVDDIPDVKADSGFEFGQIGNIADVRDALASIRIILGTDDWAVGFDREKLANIPVKGISIFFSPVKFSPTSIN